MKTMIDGYSVELELSEEDHGPVSQCFVGQKPTGRPGREFTASLECLMATGLLNHDHDYIEVPQKTIDTIEAWAITNGY